jgi:hypothetical protein
MLALFSLSFSLQPRLNLNTFWGKCSPHIYSSVKPRILRTKVGEKREKKETKQKENAPKKITLEKKGHCKVLFSMWKGGGGPISEGLLLSLLLKESNFLIAHKFQI